nr:YfgG family protein [Candidatus Symbiopectobacterium sp. NZEC135]
MATLIHKRRPPLSTQPNKRRSSRERRSGSRIAQAILLISFFILVGRFAYSSVSAFFHHQDKQQRIEQTLKSSPVNPTLSFVKKE